MNIIEQLYNAGLSLKRSAALNRQKRLPYRVISIGNITVGGTGKTPAAIAIAEEAKKRGFLPIILTRGYKGTAKGPCFVTRGGGPLLAPSEAGDEPFLMAERLKGVPVIKSTDRYAGGMYALRELGVPFPDHGSPAPVFILDDGFQHWRLHRDLDIILINATDPFGNRKLLPLGRLREPLSALNRGHAIVITKADREEGDLICEIRKYNRHAPIFFSHHRTVSVRTVTGERKPAEWLKDRTVFCLCGLADPAAFRRTVEGTGAQVAGFRAYPDHHPFSQQDIGSMTRELSLSGAAWVVTTEKDMVRLAGLDLPENILIIEITFAVDRPFFDRVFA